MGDCLCAPYHHQRCCKNPTPLSQLVVPSLHHLDVKFLRHVPFLSDYVLQGYKLYASDCRLRAYMVKQHNACPAILFTMLHAFHALAFFDGRCGLGEYCTICFPCK
jgi:hypothetical protein